MENAIKREFGEDFPQTSDSFHFKQNAVQMLSGEIGSTKDQIIFLKFVHLGCFGNAQGGRVCALCMIDELSYHALEQQGDRETIQTCVYFAGILTA